MQPSGWPMHVIRGPDEVRCWRLVRPDFFVVLVPSCDCSETCVMVPVHCCQQSSPGLPETSVQRGMIKGQAVLQLTAFKMCGSRRGRDASCNVTRRAMPPHACCRID